MRALRSRERRDRARSARVEHWKPQTFLRVAVNVVFGTPFLASLAFALRAPLWWPNRNVLADPIGGHPALLWATVAALGILWLGTISVLAPVACRRVAGALLVTVGSALLVGIYW
jgi:hypothetical protein